MVSAFPHRGEEGCLQGEVGSGALFFAGCNLGCVFCQNFGISRLGSGQESEPWAIAQTMLGLQKQGCPNINLVTPSHVVPQILEALSFAIPNGLRIPLVYNSGAYDSVETLRLLDGIIDIYMPDLKFLSVESSTKLTAVGDYGEVARNAIREMHRQVGDLQLDDRGLARRGLLVRHLVLPNGLAESEGVMHFLAREVSPDTYVNLMSKYYPSGKASLFPEISRQITAKEYIDALEAARAAGLRRFDRLEMPLRFG